MSGVPSAVHDHMSHTHHAQSQNACPLLSVAKVFCVSPTHQPLTEKHLTFPTHTHNIDIYIYNNIMNLHLLRV